jgi:proline iminopeptidase
VPARGLDFAVWTTPAVAGAVPLVCINGGLLFDHAALWPSLAPLAAGRRQLVFFDQRGRGRSQPPPGVRAARIEHDAGDVGALREALGIERWDVLGHSWGGGIAMLGASLDLAGTRRVVLVDSVAPTSWWLAGLHRTAVERLTGEARETLAALDPAALVEPDPEVHSAYARAFAPAWFADVTLAPLFTPPVTTGATGAAVAARLRRDGYDWRDRIRALDRPTLVIRGERDALPRQTAEELVALLPEATLRMIPEAGHMPFWERPETFFPVVEAFLDAPDR